MERRNRMQLHVENFAKIKEADIEIEGITVIAGENNTGKSTIGKLLYCFFNVFYNYEDRLYKQKVSALKERINNSIKVTQIISSQGRIVRKLGNFNKDLLDKFVDLFISHYHMDISLKEYADVCQAFFQSNENYHIEVDDYDVFIKQIFFILSVEKDKEINQLMLLSLNTEFHNQYLPLDNTNDVHVTLEIKSGNISFDITNSQQFMNVKTYRVLHNEIIYYDNPFVVDKLSKESFSHVMKFALDNEKEGIFVNHLDYMSILLNKPSYMNKSNIYNQILSDNIILDIEKEIMTSVHGDIVYEDGEFKFKEKNLDVALNMCNLSTGVKSFIVLLKLIKDFKIVENGTIILDEPEIHLHPKWQLKYAELLVLLQKTLNLHILINSHSPYFINAIEVYSAKHKIADRCKYYLADLDKENRAYFEDVTTNIDKIYCKLSQPLLDLEDVL